MDIVHRVAGCLSAASHCHCGATAASINRMGAPQPAPFSTTLLRDAVRPPRAPVLLNRFGDAFDAGALQQLLDELWQAVLTTLQRPIQVSHRRQYRSVTFLGVLRYRVNQDSGEVVTLEHRWSKAGYVFRRRRDIPVDLPGGRIERWAWLLLHPWWDRIENEVLRDQRKFEPFIEALTKELARALRQSVWWKRLRRTLRDELGVDRDVVRWSRKGSHRVAQAEVTQDRYNRTLGCRPIYEQLERENPNLIWVYNLALDNDVLLWSGDAVAALKEALLCKRGMTPACWRLLCRSKEQDFRMIVDWYDAEGGADFRWCEISDWLQLLVALRRRTTLPRMVIRSLFMHDPVEIDRVEQTARFRSIWMPIHVLRILLQEAERQHAAGRLRDFAEVVLTDVVTWYGTTRPNLDKNQIKQGFPYLARRAAEWKQESSALAELGAIKWDGGLEDVRVGPWTVVHLTDAFMLRQEALRMRHCADRFADDCMALEKSIFSVRNDKGKQVATLGLKRCGRAWEVFCFRGFANRPVTAGLVGVDEEVCWHFQNHWHRIRLAADDAGGEAAQ